VDDYMLRYKTSRKMLNVIAQGHTQACTVHVQPYNFDRFCRIASGACPLVQILFPMCDYSTTWLVSRDISLWGKELARIKRHYSLGLKVNK
jgi:hypothetical protein